MIRPIDLTTQLLFPMWDLKDEEDITVMMVSVEGIKDGRKMKFTWDLSDQYDQAYRHPFDGAYNGLYGYCCSQAYYQRIIHKERDFPS